MAIIMTLFVLSNFAFYHELSKEVLQETNAVAIVSKVERPVKRMLFQSSDEGSNDRRLGGTFSANRAPGSTP